MNKKVISQLRFKDDNGNHYPAWEEKKLNKISTITMGQSPASEFYNYNKIGFPLIQGNADCSNRFTNPRMFTSQITKICNIDDIIVSVRAPAGTVSISLHKACIGRGVCSIRFNYANKFLYHSLVYFEDKWKKLSQGSTFDSINSDDIKKLKINIPSLPEQTKIANFLTAIDDKIQQLTQKKQLLAQYKKGVMQQIFSQKLRFKDDNGNDYPDWEEKKLGEIIEHFGGTSLEEFSNLSGNYKFISIGNYSTDGQYIDNLQRIDGNNKSLTKLLNIDDLVMVLNDKTHSGDIIGSTILIDKCNTYIYNQRSERIVCKSIVQPKYLWCYLNSRFFRQKVFGISQGGTQIYVNFPFIKKLELLLPSLPEQIKIANFLTAIDDKITYITTQLEQTKLFKKSLLQQMFV